MTTPNEAAEAISARFVANIGTTAHTFENEDLKEPDTWMRLTIRTQARNQETLGPKGSRRYFSNASILVQCYSRTNIGRQPADTLARTVTTIFEGETFSGVTCNAAIARESPPEGKWYQIVVEVEFTYDETK